MRVIQTIAELRETRRALNGSVALVPTMGALHAGHLSLIAEARQRSEIVIVSIFVNPIQFGPREDFMKYPRPLEDDLASCEKAGANLVFNPSPEEMYRPTDIAVSLDLPELTNALEGKHRPGHFKGVCQVVAKLFNIVQPDEAYFGRKDFQQLRVIEAMVEALDWPIEVIGCPTLRDQDGLALSSRNQYLSPDERERALSIFKALSRANEELQSGVRQANRLAATMQKVLLDVGQLGRVPVSIDYAAAVDPKSLKTLDVVEGPVVLAIAARVGSTRLIDNVSAEPMSNAEFSLP